MIGIPGSGKSYEAKKIVEKEDAVSYMYPKKMSLKAEKNMRGWDNLKK